MMDSADELIEQLQLSPHPEGGWYRETWRGPQGEDGRAVGTAILFLLKAGEASHWHKVDASELWIWQRGDPLALRLFNDGEENVRVVPLGPDLRANQRLQHPVDPGEWQAAKPMIPTADAVGYSLVTCVVTPGFEFSGFELAPPGWDPIGHD